MGYPITMNTYECTRTQLKFSVPAGDNYFGYSTERAPEGLLEIKGMLMFAGLQFGEGRDFQVDRNAIVIHGYANVVTILDLILSRKDLFHLSQREMGNEDYWRNRLIVKAVESLCDKDLAQGEVEKIRPIVKTFLNQSYEDLKKEKVFALVANIVKEDYDGNLLHHPLYQALGLLQEEYQRQVNDYNALGFFKRRGIRSPDEKGFKEVLAGFKQAVPSVYKSKVITKSGESLEIDVCKINAARLKDESVKIHSLTK